MTFGAVAAQQNPVSFVRPTEWTLGAHSRDPARDPLSVSDEASFIEFVRALLSERSLDANDASRLETGSVAAFLEASLAWVQDSQFGRVQARFTTDSPWQRFAVFLHAGTVYE